MSFPAIGLWAFEFASIRDDAAVADAAAEAEALGYGVLWYPGGPKGGREFDHAERLLAATSSILVASGILNVWAWEPAEAARRTAALRAAYADRFQLGIGISHAAVIEGYRTPVATMRAFIDGLEPTLGREEIILAALGPKMLDLAAERTRGTHPYFSPVAHTAAARERVGPDALVAPEIAAVLEPDTDRARELARGHMKPYLTLPNYRNNLLRHGFSEADLDGGGSDALVDALVAYGDPEAVAARVAEHRAAGADHVCIQVIHSGDGLPVEQWRAMAPLLA